MDRRLSAQTFEELDQLIRSGRSRQAASAIQTVVRRPADWSRSDRLRLAQLARRAEVPHAGLVLLRPFVRPSAARPLRAKPEEQIEFAACLIAIGARREGRELLESLDLERFPQADLFASFALIAEWDYASAIPRLERYLRHPSLSPYAGLVGKANLAAAFVHERRHAEARPLLSELESATRSGGHTLLLRSTLKIDAESALDAGEFERADRQLQEAYELSGRSHEDDLYVEKWRAIALWLQKPSTSARHALIFVREKARRLKEWEGARDCDYHLAVRAKDRALGLKLYFGTPYEAYRARLLGDFPDLAQELDQPFLWTLAGEEGAAGGEEARDATEPIELSVDNGKNSASQLFLKTNQVQQRLLRALASDFYRPLNLAELHAVVFPMQHYQPKFSADSMHQALRRLRAFLEQACVPLRVVEDRGTYCINAQRPVRLLIAPASKSEVSRPAGATSVARLDVRLACDFERLKEVQARSKKTGRALVETLAAGDGTRAALTSLEAARIWGVSRNSALNRLRQLVEAGLLRREGAARGVRYVIVM